MSVELSIQDAKEFLIKIFSLKEPPTIILLGPPGIGKSTAIQEALEEVMEKRGKRVVRYGSTDLNELLRDDVFPLVDLRLSEIEPTDLTGMPVVREGRFEYVPPEWAYVLGRKPGALFLDEITNVIRADTRSSSFQLTNDKFAGLTALHPETIVVAAGNREEDSSIVEQLPASLVNRAIILKVRPPTIEEWTNWMDEQARKKGKKYAPEVLAFLLAFKGDNPLYKEPKGPETLEQFPSPRSWSRLAWLIAEARERGIEFEKAELQALASGLVGSEMGTKFVTFVTSKPPQIEELIENPEMFRNLKLDQKYLEALFLASWLLDQKSPKEAVKKAAPLMKVMADEQADLVMVMIRKINNSPKKRAPKIIEEITKIPELEDLITKIAELVLSMKYGMSSDENTIVVGSEEDLDALFGELDEEEEQKPKKSHVKIPTPRKPRKGEEGEGEAVNV